MAIDQPSYKRRLPAGFLDSAFASLATFAVGLTAVNLLDDVNRGVYTVYFTAFMLGTVLPRNLIFTPAEVHAVSYPNDQRLSVINQSVVFGVVPGLVGALAAAIAYVVTLPYATPSVSIALLVTTAVTIVLSPMQDHVRRMLHIAAWSWRAATVSVVQFVTVAVVVGAGLLLDVAVGWIPFGALVVANAVSLLIAWLIGRRSVEVHAPNPLRFKELAARGGWLVVHAAAPSLTGFVVAALIAALASPEVLGFAESARVVAQPILVLAAGLTAVLAPRSMRAAMDRDVSTARRTQRSYLAIMMVAGIGYIAIAGWDWALNPMAYLVPSAYFVAGLVAVTVVANLSVSFVFLQVNELLGGHKERVLAALGWVVAPVGLLVGLTAGTTGAFARPLATLARMTVNFSLQAAALRSMYRLDRVQSDVVSDMDTFVRKSSGQDG